MVAGVQLQRRMCGDEREMYCYGWGFVRFEPLHGAYLPATNYCTEVEAKGCEIWGCGGAERGSRVGVFFGM